MTSLPSCSAFARLAQVRKPATASGEGQTASCACPFPATNPNIEAAAPTRLRILVFIASSHRQRCLFFCMRDSRVDVNRRGRVREHSWRSVPVRAGALIAAAPVRRLRNLALIIQVATVFNGGNFVYFRCVLPESLDRRRAQDAHAAFRKFFPAGLYSATGVCNRALWAKSPARKTTLFRLSSAVASKPNF